VKWQVIYTNREFSPFKTPLPLRKIQTIKEIIDALKQVKNFSPTAQNGLVMSPFLFCNQPKPLT